MLKAVPAALALGLLGCAPDLPDPEAPGARVLVRRCTGCHGLSQPASMTLEMWKVQLTRMRLEFTRRGMPWLSAAEEAAVMDYLAAHAGRS